MKGVQWEGEQRREERTLLYPYSSPHLDVRACCSECLGYSSLLPRRLRASVLRGTHTHRDTPLTSFHSASTHTAQGTRSRASGRSTRTGGDWCSWTQWAGLPLHPTTTRPSSDSTRSYRCLSEHETVCVCITVPTKVSCAHCTLLNSILSKSVAEIITTRLQEVPAP